MAAKGKTLMKNGLENHYIIKDNKKLYFGYTTGSCAAGAAKAAAVMLFTGQDIRQADLMTPRGILLHLEVEDIRREQGQVSCAIRKDGGTTGRHPRNARVCIRKKVPKVQVSPLTVERAWDVLPERGWNSLWELLPSTVCLDR